MNIVLSEHVRSFVEQYSTDPSHALLLAGPQGIGLRTLALYLAENAGVVLDNIEPVAKTPKGQAIISVERVRQLYDATRTSLAGKNFVIIDDADRMNHAAQNSLLKLLEEPNPSVFFILTSHSPDSLLPTVRSRSWRYNVPPLDEMSSHRLLRSLGVDDQTRQAQLMYIAGGLPAELTRLAGGKDFDALLISVQRSKAFIAGSPYDRLIIANELKEDREAALRFIDTTVLLLKRTVEKSANPRSTLRLIDGLLDAHAAIRANGNVRLQLASAVI